MGLGGLGIVLISRGPGLTNALTALANAVKGRRSLLAISTDSSGGPFDLMKLISQPEMASSVGLAYFAPEGPYGVVSSVRDAHRSALRGRPALVAVPTAVLRATGAAQPPRTGEQEIAPPLPSQRDSKDVDAVAEVLARSERPLILAGRGAVQPEAAALLGALAERTGALLGTSLLPKSLFRGHPLDIGVVGGFASQTARRLISTVDCVLAFGASLNAFTRGPRHLFEGARIVQIDSDAGQIGLSGRVDIGVVADAAATAAQLLQRVERPQPRPTSTSRSRGRPPLTE